MNSAMPPATPPATPQALPDGLAKAESLKLDLQNVASIIGTARALVAEGQPVNLAPLENEVRRLCETILALPGADNVPLRPMMVSLIDDLDKLAGDIRRRHADLKSQLESLSSGSRAAAAYTPPGLRRP
ncbi:MAG: hypothetical protein ACK4NA_01280 [Alphaproteobacteria bacterium]